MFSAILFYYKLYYTFSFLNKQFGLKRNLEMYMKRNFLHNIIIFFKKNFNNNIFTIAGISYYSIVTASKFIILVYNIAHLIISTKYTIPTKLFSRLNQALIHWHIRRFNQVIPHKNKPD